MTEAPKLLPYLVHCEPCGGTGLVVNASAKELFVRCPVCNGQGRRVVHPYREGGGEQGETQ